MTLVISSKLEKRPVLWKKRKGKKDYSQHHGWNTKATIHIFEYKREKVYSYSCQTRGRGNLKKNKIYCIWQLATICIITILSRCRCLFLSYVRPFILFKILVRNMQNYKLLVFSASTINMVYKITRFQSQIGLANKNTKDLFWFMPLLAR
jgi:hypothetical protein